MSYCVSRTSLRVRLAMYVVCCATGDWSQSPVVCWSNFKCFNV